MVTYEDEDDLTIDGVNINKLSPQLVGADTLVEIQNLNIFNHVTDSTQRTALNNQLLARVARGLSIPFPEITIAHTQGVKDVFVGGPGGKIIASAYGGGINSAGELILMPAKKYWFHVAVPARATKFKVRTNIVANDVTADGTGVVVWYGSCFLYSEDNGTVGQRSSVFFAKTGPQLWDPGDVIGIVAGTPVTSSTAQVGDAGTFYVETPVYQYGLSSYIGTNPVGQAGSHNGIFHCILGFQIEASVLTKNYKFRVELEYENL